MTTKNVLLGTCPSPHCATYLLLIIWPVCINQHEAQLCQTWGWAHSKWCLMCFMVMIVASTNSDGAIWAVIQLKSPFSDCTPNCDTLKWAPDLFLWTWKNIDNMSIVGTCLGYLLNNLDHWQHSCNLKALGLNWGINWLSYNYVVHHTHWCAVHTTSTSYINPFNVLDLLQYSMWQIHELSLSHFCTVCFSI